MNLFQPIFIFSHLQSSPEKDTNVFTVKASLKSADKLVLQTSWNWDFFSNAMEGLKSRIPAMTSTILKFVNKYHTSLFGFDLNRGGVKLKHAISNLVERAHHGVLVSLTTLQDLIQTFAHQGKEALMNVFDSLMSTDLKDFREMMLLQVKTAFRHIRVRVEELLHPVAEFLTNKKFTIPGSERKLSIVEMFEEAHQAASESFEVVSQLFFRLLEKISAFIKSIEFTVPETDVSVNGRELVDNLNAEINAAKYHLKHYLRSKMDTQVIREKAESLYSYLKDRNTEVTPQIEAFYAEILRSSKQGADDAQRHAAECKDLLKLKLQDFYNALNLEAVKGGAQQFISVLQSNVSEALSESVDLMRNVSQNTAPYIRVGKEKVDVEIPLPFLWKSFNEWPTQLRP